MAEAERHPPVDIEAEQNVLGSILIDPDVISKLAPILKPEHFYRESHRWIYEAALALMERDVPTEATLVRAELAAHDRVRECGDLPYLSELISLCPTSVFACDYADVVRKCSVRRRLISAGQKIAAWAYTEAEPGPILSKAYEELMQIGGQLQSRGLRKVSDIVRDRSDAFDYVVNHPTEQPGITTGMANLDETFNGFEPGRFYVVAARTSMGKSAFVLNVAMNLALREFGVAIYTLEMSETAEVLRLVMARAKLDRYAIRHGFAGADWPRKFMQALGEVGELPIWIDDYADSTTQDIRAGLTQLKAREPGLRLAIVDYGELVGDREGKGEQERVSAITRKLQAAARSLELPILAVYQLNREPEKRDKKTPQLSDLRMSGMIEQAADCVILLYSPAYYAEQKGETPTDETKHQLNAIVAKQRDGKTGAVKLWFDRTTGQISGWLDGQRAAESVRGRGARG